MNTINNTNFRQSSYRYNNNVNFQGMRNPLKNIRTISSVLGKKALDSEKILNNSHILNLSPEKVEGVVKNASKERLMFFDALVDRYNSKNYFAKTGKENPQEVLDIFQMVKKPTLVHYEIINNSEISTSNAKKILLLADNKPKRLKFVNTVYDEVVNSSNSPFKRTELITELLASKNSEKYVKDYPKYKSYLILNKDNKEAVSTLDKMVEAGTFNPKTYNIELATKKLFNPEVMKETPVLNRAVINEHYTEEGKSFLEHFTHSFGVSEESLAAGNDKDILDMFKSTTKKNLNIRASVIESFQSSQMANLSLKGKNEELTEMKKLFDRMDNDKHAKNFVKKTIIKHDRLESIKEYNELLDNVPSKKLDIFYDNACNIIYQKKGEERISTLQKEIENPFFETGYVKDIRQNAERLGYRKPESFVSKFFKRVSNGINKLKSALTPDAPKSLPKTEVVVPQTVIKEVVPVVVQPKVVEVVEGPVKISNNVAKSIKKAPNAKKLQVINDVNNVIEKKLGAKTLEAQQEQYAKKATKMRLSLLPEIFASIKETRAVDKAVGKKVSESNKDALNLYEKINGKNKKLVNYMLKKRNADGSRMFGVKDIINAVDNAETKIVSKKQASVITSPSDIKMYYAHLHDAKIQQYGKLDRKQK